MSKTPLTLILLILPLMMPGCRYFPLENGQDASSQGAAELTRPDPRGIAELLGYYRGLDGLDENGLKTRLTRLQSRLQKDDCSTVRLKSAMILSKLSAHSGGPNSQTILDPCLNNAFNRYSAAGKLAFLLQELIETRKAADGAQAELQNYHYRIKTLQDENEKLHKQLEGIKAIEKSIQQRNQH
ncbi:MAG: hypothetical protein J5I81_00905 [Nitrococcus mobilis]|nr:hypothetical protein [Nitrococcus mobilis]